MSNLEVDSLDRYFFLIVPYILADEILADLTKEADPDTPKKIARHTYRVSGNHGLTMDYRKRLTNSLVGKEIPMDGRFLPSAETVVRTEGGSLATVVETPLEDEILARWEHGKFTDQEKVWAQRFRRRTERPLNPKLYLDNIAKAGLSFDIPQSDEELIATVNKLLADRKLLPRLFVILAREFGMPFRFSDEVTKRWYKDGRKPFEQFAPYAFFCLRANFLWNLGLTNPQLFKPDKNDRKDLEYCYYLPNTQVFASKDNKHKRLVPAFLRPDQSCVDGEVLKADLKRISENWEKLTKEEKIALNKERADAPPENEDSIVYQLWKKHDGKLNPSQPLEILDIKLVDSSLPKDQQVPITFRELLQKKSKELKAGKKLSQPELDELNRIHQGKDPTTMLMFKTKVSRERLRKWHPELTEEDLDKAESDD